MGNAVLSPGLHHVLGDPRLTFPWHLPLSLRNGEDMIASSVLQASMRLNCMNELWKQGRCGHIPGQRPPERNSLLFAISLLLGALLDEPLLHL